MCLLLNLSRKIFFPYLIESVFVSYRTTDTESWVGRLLSDTPPPDPCISPHTSSDLEVGEEVRGQCKSGPVPFLRVPVLGGPHLPVLQPQVGSTGPSSWRWGRTV